MGSVQQDGECGDGAGGCGGAFMKSAITLDQSRPMGVHGGYALKVNRDPQLAYLPLTPAPSAEDSSCLKIASA